jgi:hypothetical protein
MTRRGVSLQSFDARAVEHQANVAAGNQAAVAIADLVDRVGFELARRHFPGWFARLVASKTLSGKAKGRRTARKCVFRPI